MIIEDDPDVRELCRDVLSHAGYQVLIAENGRAALALLETLAVAPAVILTDLVMPEMGGVDFVLRLRFRRHRSIPVVLITASDCELGSKRRALFDRCVQKPLAPWTLIGLVSELSNRGEAAGAALKKRWA
jgi:CheY-like chemotaxis protein